MDDCSTSSDPKSLFLEKVRLSNAACQAGDFAKAVTLYSQAIALDPANHILYSNRSAAHIKRGQFNKALKDAVRARELNPEWPKAYYRQGVALQCLGRHAEALGAFAAGLAQDPKSLQLLSGLVEAAMKSPLRGTLEPTYRQLQAMKLDKSPFVLISVIGQELLAQGKYSHAVQVLESALKIGTCSLKLRGSVFSALSSAYWALNTLDKAIGYMQQDLVVAKQLTDVPGECRAHGNLGSAYFSKGNYKEALTSHRYQLVLAMKCKDSLAATAALTSLGHVYTAIGDYPNALASHKQCVEIIQEQIGDKMQEAREVGNVGAVYLAMGDFDKAVECHMEHLKIATAEGNKVEEARAYSNLGSSAHYKRSFEQSIVYHNHVLRLAQELKDKAIEARAYAGLGHAARCMGNFIQAKVWHEKQLDMALATKDKVAEGRACSNIGIVYQLFGDHDAALKLHQAHLNLARQLHDKAGMGRAFGNIGNAYSSSGFYEQAIKYHKQELTISKEVNDRSSEASTHGNLAVAYQALSMHEMALVHYHSHLNIARELKDTTGEALALCNLGNCHSSRGEFAQAVPFYENYLMLSQELSDVEGEAKACHFLGYAHYCLGNHKEAIRYYDQDLALARDQQDRMNMGRAYCNLGLAHLAIGNHESALECQKYFLAIAQVMKHNQARFRALGNLGDVLSKMGQSEEAIAVYMKQLSMAKSIRDKGFEATAYGALGICHRKEKQFDKSLAFHTQELSILQDIGDMGGECKAHGHMGAVHLSLGNYIHAMKCYAEQLERARDIKDSALEAQAQGNLGITRINLGRHEEALGCFEQQLACLEPLTTGVSAPPTTILEKGRAFGNLGTCYDALGDYEEAVKCQEQYLAVSLKLKATKDQDRAYRELGLAHKSLGNLQQALVCFEKRLVAAHDLVQPSAKGSAYGELGEIHAQLGNFEQAISCIEHQLTAAKTSNDRALEAKASSGLGLVHHKMSEWNIALRYHTTDLEISEELSDKNGQARALSNIGAAYEGMGDLEKAVSYNEQFLNAAKANSDAASQTKAFGSLGRLKHGLGNLAGAISSLQQGLVIAEQTLSREDEGRIRHRLGMAMWQSGDLESAHIHLDRAASLFESIRREAKGTSDYKLTLFDLQTECYQVLQRVLVTLGRENEALVVAERGKTRAFADLLLERQGKSSSAKMARLDECTPTSVSDIITLVNRQKASVLYYSLAMGYLHIWLIVPTKGIVKFHQSCVNGKNEDEGNVLEENIQSVREALGIAGSCDNDKEEDESMWSNHLDALGDKLNQEGDRTGFLRMVNRSSRLNASSYSLSSLFSVGSVGAGSTITALSSRHGSTRSRRNHWQGPSCLKKLYQLLLEPLEDEMPEGFPSELMLVLEGDLYLVPFAMLKGPLMPEPLCERYSLLVTPSLTSMKSARMKNNRANKDKADEDQTATLVVGNPKLPSSVCEQWGWTDIPSAGQEASIIGEIMQTAPLTGEKATKEAVLENMGSAECIHLACHVSWKLSAVVLSPGEFVESKSSSNSGHPKRYSIHSDTIHESEEDIRSEVTSTIDTPSLSEFLLTAADILNMKLSAKLVVLSSCYTKDEHGMVTSDGLIALTKALLAAGAQCVLVSLWPVPSAAVNVIMKAFYSALLQGARASRALADAMTTVQNTKQLQHPTNWAGFVLIGADIKVSNKVALMGQALREMLSTPDKCRDALRVTLHLVEKSLQRIHRNYKNAMYTSQKSIETKVGQIKGWKDLLISVGFRFEPGTNGIPPSVFFPQNDPGERLTQCSASLQAVLGLSQNSWVSLCKLLSCTPEDADEIIAIFRTVSVDLNSGVDEVGAQVPVNVKVWRIPGCHELLASLGFDLMEVGKEDVILKTGKTVNRRQIQFALQALLALFDTTEAPRCIDLEEDDMESSFEEEEDDLEDSEEDNNTSPEMTPFPAPRKTSLILDGHSGAFTSYVRNRGEPDGRTNDSPPHPSFPQTSIPPPPPMVLAQSAMVMNPHHTKGHESDYNFTPSPVNPVPKMYGIRNPAGLLAGSGHHMHTHAGPFNYGQQRRMAGIASSSSTASERAETSSSASSITDWKIVKGPNMHPALQSKLDQALNELSGLTSPRKPKLSGMPLYENSSVQYSSRQPAGKPVTPIRSVFTDVGYQSMQKITDKSDPNDKFSVRAETRLAPANLNISNIGRSSSNNDIPSDSRLNPGVTRRMPPTGESDSPENTILSANVPKRSSYASMSGIGAAAETASITTISSANTFIIKADDNTEKNVNTTDLSEVNFNEGLKTNLRRISRDPPPISEVYHERNIGLGLAPPLTSLLMNTNLQVVQVEHHSDSEGSAKNMSMKSDTPLEESFNNFDNLSVIEHAHKQKKQQQQTVVLPPPPIPQVVNPPAKRRPPIPPKPDVPAWSPNNATAHVVSARIGLTRDEGDGRSMTDSQYSGYSPNTTNGQQHHHPHAVPQPQLGDVVSKMNYLKLRDYMNDQEITVIEETDEKMIKKNAADGDVNTFVPNGAAKQMTKGDGDTKHPHQLWSRDKNGALHYTGLFSSDC